MSKFISCLWNALELNSLSIVVHCQCEVRCFRMCVYILCVFFVVVKHVSFFSVMRIMVICGSDSHRLKLVWPYILSSPDIFWHGLLSTDYVLYLHAIGQISFQSLPSSSIKTIGKQIHLRSFRNPIQDMSREKRGWIYGHPNQSWSSAFGSFLKLDTNLLKLSLIKPVLVRRGPAWGVCVLRWNIINWITCLLDVYCMSCSKALEIPSKNCVGAVLHVIIVKWWSMCSLEVH